MVTDIMEYYFNECSKPGCFLLLDASKAFDRVSYEGFFNLLLDRNVKPSYCNISLKL